MWAWTRSRSLWFPHVFFAVLLLWPRSPSFPTVAYAVWFGWLPLACGYSTAWFDSGYLFIRPSTVVFFEPVRLTVTCSVLVLPEVCRIMVFWEVTSGICFGILYQCLVRQRMLFLRQSSELFEEAHIFSPCLSEMTKIVSVFSAELGSTADTGTASVYGAF